MACGSDGSVEFVCKMAQAKEPGRNQEGVVIHNHKLCCLFRRAALRVLVFTVITTIPLSAWTQSGTSTPSTQSGTSRELTLIHSTDSQFDSLLTQNYPGLLQTLADYPTVRPFLVLLSNETTHSAPAYSIEFNYQAAGAPQGPQFGAPLGQQMRRMFIQGESGTKVDSRAFGPGEVRLISPTFNMSPADYREADGRFSVALSQASRPPLPLSIPNMQVSAVVDCVVYQDGMYLGPDHSLLEKRYQAVSDALRDEGAAILKVANPTSESVLAQLTQDAAPVRQMPPITGGKVDPDKVYQQTYALQRANKARSFMGRLQGAGGLDFVLRQASIMANTPQVSLSPMSQ
jgi:hypothetical protein